MATEVEVTEVEHLAAVERALAKRGVSMAEYCAELAAKRAAASETASDAEAAHLRRLPAAKLLTVAHDGAVRRGQWIEATAEVLAATRKRCQRLLPWHDAEDMAADIFKRELLAADEANRPGCVRAERLTAAYLALTAKQWRTDHATELASEMTEDESARADLLAAEEITPLADADTEVESVWRTYAVCQQVCERVCLPATLPIVASLAQGLTDMTAAELAPLWGIGAKVWEREAGSGAREIRASYPDAHVLLLRLIPEHNLAVRATPLAERKLGAPVPKVSRRRNTATAAREADVLLARPALPGRKAKASKRTSGEWRAPLASAEWQTVRPLAATDLAAPLRRLLAAKLAAASPRHGARPHRAAPGWKVAPEIAGGTAPERDGALGMFQSLAATYRLLPARTTGSAAEVLANLAALERLAEHTQSALARTAPVDRQLATYQPGKLAAGSTKRASTSPVLAAARASMANLAATDTVAAPSLYRPASGYRQTHRYRTWRLVWMPVAKRRGALADRSLDTVSAAELEREQAQSFAMVEDMISAASE